MAHLGMRDDPFRYAPLGGRHHSVETLWTHHSVARLETHHSVAQQYLFKYNKEISFLFISVINLYNHHITISVFIIYITIFIFITYNYFCFYPFSY